MADEIVTGENLSQDMLKQLFEDAYMDTTVDTDGDIIVKDGYKCFLRADPQGHWIRAYSIFRDSEEASQLDKLEFVNHVNDELVIIRASVASNGALVFEHYIPVEGGITKRAIVFAVKRFLSGLPAAMSRDTANVIPS